MRKQSKQSISVIQRKLWEHCKRIVRTKYKPVCYTCGKFLTTSYDQHTGHVPWPKSVLGAFLKYDLRVLRIQCFACNVHRGGMGAEAYKRMLEEIGQKEMAKLERDRNKTVKAYDHYTKLLSEYEKL